jgi:hypothetical protein
MKRTLILTGEAARKAACREILAAPEGYAVTIGEKTRSLDQNALLWALLSDLAEQTDWHGMKLAPEEWKDLLSAGLTKSKVVPNIEGNGFVIIGQRTSKMGKREFSDLCDLIMAFGNERGVVWSGGLAA